jgi:NAD(P)H-hydrate epimerase
MINTEEMRQLEDNCGIPKLQLMENAGKGIYNVLKEKFPNLKDKKILIATYHGNNGGDGFVAARYLCEEAETDVLFVGDENKFKEEAENNFKRIENNKRIQLLTEPEQIDFNDYDIIIDALLGTGVSGEIQEPIASVIEEINNSTAFKVAVDIPSGINPDTGEPANKAINSDLIITLHDIKQGIEKFKNKAIIIDIGI